MPYKKKRYNSTKLSTMYGPTHPWVVPLGMSHLDFLGLIKTLKNHKKHLNKFFQNFFYEYIY
jgi:hypothetical protein